MKCPKCGKMLPDDSEFCQYCGSRIEQPALIPDPPAEPAEKKCPKCGMLLPKDSDFCQYCGGKLDELHNAGLDGPALSSKPATAIDRLIDDKSAASIISMLSNNMVDNIKANHRLAKKHTSDSDYGLVPEKPIFTFMVDGAKSYLNSLVTENNEELTWHRKGSIPVKGISGPVDIYASEKKTGEQYKTLYVSIYAEANSQSIPRGFIRKGSGPKASHSTHTTTPGGISNIEQKKSPLRIALIVIAAVGILLLSALNVFQFVMHKNDQERISKDQERIAVVEQANKELAVKLAEQDGNNSKKIEELNSQIASKDATIADKDKKIQSQENTISSQNSKISSLEKDADSFTTLCSLVKSGNVGYGTSTFYCTPAIVYVKKGETKKIKLITSWSSDGGTISTSYCDNAYVTFDENNWGNSTTLSVKGYSAGVSSVTFSRDFDTVTFKVIIIVE